MCGILFFISRSDPRNNPHNSRFNRLLSKLQAATSSRGPDAQDVIYTDVQELTLTFCASELRLRGDAFIKQPHTDDTGNILCWNGEVFEGLDVGPDENDGAKLFSSLTNAKDSEEVTRIFGNIEGPYAFLFYQKASRKLFFGRDPLGRRSLLIHYPSELSPYFLLASVSAGLDAGYALEEVSTEHICSLDLSSLVKRDSLFQSHSCITLVPRTVDGTQLPFARPSAIERSIPDDPPRPQSLDDIPPHLSTAVDDLISQLERSVMLRVRDIPRRGTVPGQARVAVFFSGGIDSTMIAFLADRHVAPDEPIDLLNVAFENPRKIAVKVEGNIYGLPKREKKQKLRDPLDYSTVKVTYDVPDRLTGLQEVEELRRLCPKRTWNFLEINVPYEESQNARAAVEALMFPSRTVMDLSLAIALYFAARGVGQIRSHPGAEPQPYTSPARVLLNGLGSDELLGGYGRHRTAFKAAGWQAVIDELQLEIDRIPTRNLGRDDRVISSWGKETRHPFLSLSVVNFLAQLPVHLKLDPRLEAGVGEKLLLRLAARKVGLVEASGRKKRAMQFGSHSARMAPGENDGKGDLSIDTR
ncbi:asparagine synthase-domain-containing protein [Dichomitus squalens]|uniref:Asparagine synthase-domain-containing protein n=1 Tax=Dichomitus squalens TaxID=114155 RepID=A0A4Q9N6X0_9APHY|nr:asparagine synthase-domain-containing protein [Dichomitus squalens]